MAILDQSHPEEKINFQPAAHSDTAMADYEISDDIFSEEHQEAETMVQRKSFFAKLFSTN